jgi:hypothetical protein
MQLMGQAIRTDAMQQSGKARRIIEKDASGKLTATKARLSTVTEVSPPAQTGGNTAQRR